MFALFALTGALDFPSTMALAPYLTVEGLTLVCILFFLGAVGKSAQLGLHTWLPDAMEGPTPVSALIHAATMVTAGVYLIIRCSPLFEFSTTSLWVVAIVGGMTAFFAATVGVVQSDMKKVIAYSTCSQLGYMVLAAGLSAYGTSLFHLANHAFFKALLFLSAGAVIHALGDEQDLRRMGGLASYLPFSLTVVWIGSLALAGFPYLAGFYSKDAILEASWAHWSIEGTMGYWLGTMAALLTAFYSLRLIILAFFVRANFSSSVTPHESPLSMAFPLAILGLGSILVGFLGKDLFIGLASPFFGQSISILPHDGGVWSGEFLPVGIKLLPVLFSFSGIVLACVIYVLFPSFVPSNTLYSFLVSKWYFDHIYNKFIGEPILRFGYNGTYKAIDLGILETLGGSGIVNIALPLTRKLSRLQSGQLYHYALVFFAGMTFYIGLVV